ncbi:hypothetical protein RU93_GL001027 [Enterococcus aquimarinus]|uniref:Uncharacterized protein n=1 Tax=Enterococcus aquimarinus TaxID=328396 RepID=A0A1L8QWF2_9ENTE|nr:hypothetical protein RU93_GL001027 [Enterococcus aquimarinus]
MLTSDIRIIRQHFFVNVFFSIDGNSGSMIFFSVNGPFVTVSFAK